MLRFAGRHEALIARIVLGAQHGVTVSIAMGLYVLGMTTSVNQGFVVASQLRECVGALVVIYTRFLER